MKYMILSDIHGSLPRLERALNIYEEERCDMLCILGDILNYGPRNGVPEGLDAQAIARRLNMMADDIIAVRGNCDSEVDQMLLDFPIGADYALIADEGKRILLTHGHIYHKEHLPRGRFDIVFYGHTHLWELTKHEGTVCCNTGSITFPKAGNPPTIAVYENCIVKVLDISENLTSPMCLDEKAL